MKDSLLEKSDEKIVEKYQELVTLCKKQTISPETLDHLMDLLCSDKLFFNALTTTSLTSKFGKGNKRQLRRTMSLSHDGWILGASIHISFSKPCTVNADEEGGLSCTETLCRDITIPLEALRGGFSAKNILQEMEICDNIMISNIL